MRAAFPDAVTLAVEDTSSGCGSSYRVVLVAASLPATGGPLARPRAVHAALGPAFISGIHALEIKATLPPATASSAAPAPAQA